MCAAINTQETTQSTVNSNVTSALTSADGTAAQRVQTLGQVHQARVAQLSRVATSAVAQYGATSQQAKVAKAAVSAQKVTVARIAQVHRQVTATAPQVAANGWALYGHVFNSQLKPVSSYTVFLVDEQNAYQSAYGFAYTDSDGSFEINFQGSANSPKTPQLFLEVVNDKAMPVYLSTSAFQPKIGSATYQDVTLASGEAIIGDPPDEIRAIAIPDTGNASGASGKGKKT